MGNFFYRELSDNILGAVFKVHNYLGPGLLESAYEACLVIELKKRGLHPSRQVVFPIYYGGELASAYLADLIVDDKIILELKSVQVLSKCMEAQLLNYLRISGLKVGYLINFFGVRAEWKRFVL